MVSAQEIEPLVPTPRTTCPKWNYLSNEKVIALELSSRPGAGVGERVHGAGTGRLDSRAERLGVLAHFRTEITFIPSPFSPDSPASRVPIVAY